VLFAIASIALALEYWPGDELTFGERAAIAGTGLLLATLHVVVGRLVLEGVAVLFDVLATLRDIRADLRERA